MQPIHYAAQGGNMAMIDELVCFYEVDPNALVSYIVNYIATYVRMYVYVIKFVKTGLVYT